MNSQHNEFAELVDRAARKSNFAHLRNSIEKELLIYDILFCLHQNNLLDNIVFQGGTLLRLGHGAERFSDDLDFVTNSNFALSSLVPLKPLIEHFFVKRYGLAVDVKEPDFADNDTDSVGVKVHRWRVNAATNPERKNSAKQRIKIEIATVPAYTKQIVAIRPHYDILPDGYEDVLIISETLNEVMADKIVSLPATERYIRYRDIWDLCWLIKRGAKVDSQLVSKKVVDYRLTEYVKKLRKTIDNLQRVIASVEFQSEMNTLLPIDVFERTLGNKHFVEHLFSSVRDLFEQVQDSLK